MRKVRRGWRPKLRIARVRDSFSAPRTALTNKGKAMRAGVVARMKPERKDCSGRIERNLIAHVSWGISLRRNAAMLTPEIAMVHHV